MIEIFWFEPVSSLESIDDVIKRILIKVPVL